MIPRPSPAPLAPLRARLRPSTRVVLVSALALVVSQAFLACRKQAAEVAPGAGVVASAEPLASGAAVTLAVASASAAASVQVPTAVFGSAGAGGAAGATGAPGGGIQTDKEPDDGPCPASMALVGRTCVDRWEAHLATIDEAGKMLVHPHNQRPEEGVRYLAVSEAGVFPQGYMSRVESEAACKQAGKRLCSMNEWRTACAGKKHFTYPYGNRREKDRCSSGKKHLLSELFGKNGKAWKYENFNDPILLATEGYLDKTGSHEGCQSDAGVFDMVGNLHEWVKDTVTDELFERMEAEPVERKTQPWRTGNGVFMGGFFSTGGEHGPGCTFTTIAHEPRYHDYSIGFRCCKDANLPKPEKPTKKPK